MSRKMAVIAAIALVALLAFATFAFAQSGESAPSGSETAPVTCPLTGEDVSQMQNAMASGNIEEMHKLYQQRMGRGPQGGGVAPAALDS